MKEQDRKALVKAHSASLAKYRKAYVKYGDRIPVQHDKIVGQRIASIILLNVLQFTKRPKLAYNANWQDEKWLDDTFGELSGLSHARNVIVPLMTARLELKNPSRFVNVRKWAEYFIFEALKGSE